MKRSISFVYLGAIVAASLFLASRPGSRTVRAAVGHAPESVAAVPPMGKLVVHEWGTFTGFAGSDGVHLPFRTQIGSDLPPFVMNRLTEAARLDPKLAAFAGMVFQKAGGAAALQRMETPVVYFYADAPGEARVRVDFPGGLLTEFYPPVRSMGPKFGAAVGEIGSHDGDAPRSDAPQTHPSAAGPFSESFLDWGRVRIIPHPTADESRLVPATNAGHYQFARDTDSALLQFTGDGKENDYEKFLFYRGLGNFTLPVTLTARGGDRFEFRNAGSSPVSWAFLIRVEPDGHRSPRFARFENLAGNQELMLPAANPTQDNLKKEIEKALVSSGLFEKEARAMVETWQAGWLDEPGTRVLYVVPRTVTDALLPLRIEPAPDDTVRVLVGRIDVLTPEQESRLRSMTQSADAATTLSEQELRLLSGLGRFLSPALERVSRAGDKDAEKRAEYVQEALSRSMAKR